MQPVAARPHRPARWVRGMLEDGPSPVPTLAVLIFAMILLLIAVSHL